MLVAFLQGDADRPVVIGCLHNTTHPTSYHLPAHATRSGIRTRSVPSSDGHFVVFDGRPACRFKRHAHPARVRVFRPAFLQLLTHRHFQAATDKN